MSSDIELFLKIGNLSIPYTLSDSQKAKHIRLVIDVNGLRVVKPSKTKFDEVDKILKSKINWIYKHHMDFKTMNSPEHNRNWESGESVLFRGEKYTIRIFLHKEKSTLLHFNGESFEIFVYENVDENERRSQIESAFIRWYIGVANETIVNSLAHYCKITGLTYNTMKVKMQKTRWGSCSSKGNLNFNWKLIMSPPWVFEYVIVHEICHLKHLNHSKQYWSMVEGIISDYKKAQEWLKKNGLQLRF